MERWSIRGETLGAIADGARNALGEFGQLTPAQMAERLSGVRTIEQRRDVDTRPDTSEWALPEGWPDIDTLLDADPATDVIYMTYDASRGVSALALRIETTSGNPTVEIGHVEAGAFVADETVTVTRNTNWGHWMDGYDGLVVVRVTGTITRCNTIAYTNGGRTQAIGTMPVVQRAARVPHLVALDGGNSNSYRWSTVRLVRDRVENGDGSALTRAAVAWFCAYTLRSLDISGLKTQNVTTFGSAFRYCMSLRSLDLTHLDTGNVTTMDYAFADCASLRSVNLAGLDFGKCANWSYAFSASRSLATIGGVSSLVRAAATNVSYMFNTCLSLTALDLSGWVTTGVTTVAATFYACVSLKTLAVPWDTPALTSMASTFYQCFSLKGVDLSTWDLSRVTAFSSTFCNCYALRGVRFPDTENEVATTVGQMFDACWTLLGVDLSWLRLTSRCTNICYMFRECRELRALDLPEWDLTGLSSAANMSHTVFANCRSLKRITGIRDWQFRHTNSIGSMFSGCWSLEEADVSGWDVSTVSSLASLFNECFSLRELDLSGWRPRGTSVALGSMFLYCHSLVTIGDVSAWRPQPTSTASMFSECFSLREFPDVTLWDMSVCTTTASMFNSCRSLTSMDLHGLSMPKCTTVASMFNACYNLRSLDVGGWSLPALTTAPGTFAGNCWSLVDLVPPSFPLNHSYTACHSLSQESVLVIIDALPAVTAARTLNLNASNLSRLTAEEKAVATAKKWTLAN